MTEKEDVAKIREILRGWIMPYERHFEGGSIWGWEPIPVDEMTDDEVLEVARGIAERK